MSPGREGDISKCPVMHNKGGSSGGGGGGGLMGIFGSRKQPEADAAAPAGGGAAPADAAASAASSNCPVMRGGKPAESPAAPPTYNEYGEQVDPRNQMPAANQEPWPGQQQRLSTERVQSTIPKGKGDGDDGETWTYPSPQQFYNALKRKGKGADVSEEQVDTLVSIHNNMNDVTWQMLLEWERYHIDRGNVEGGTPMLAKFMGRPFDLTPKARIKSWLGYGLPVRHRATSCSLALCTPHAALAACVLACRWPLRARRPLTCACLYVAAMQFDRHDWDVDRGNGKGTTRYVIDYYYDNAKSEQDAVPDLGMQATASDIQSIIVDVRPALDSLDSVYHRLRRFPERLFTAVQRGMPVEPDMEGPGTGYGKEAAEKKERISALAAAAQPAMAAAEAGPEDPVRVSVCLPQELSAAGCQQAVVPDVPILTVTCSCF
jgi:cytochrome c heme-lyase